MTKQAPLTFFLFVAILAFAGAAHAADAIYPVGSRIGLVPPAGLTTSPEFQGYGDADKEAAIIILPLPANAFEELQRTLSTATLKKEGIVVQKREAISVPLGKGFLIAGRQKLKDANLRKWVLVATNAEVTALVTAQVPEKYARDYPDAVMRAALLTLQARASVPDTEQLALLPFNPGDLAEFKIAAVVPRRALLLSDAVGDDAEIAKAPHIAITIGPDSPRQADERDTFARNLFSSVSSIKDVRIVSSEPLRIGGQPGHQILADAKDAKSEAAIKIVQWIRFGGGAHMQLIGTSLEDAWPTAFPRFRAVRDGIDLR